MTKAVSAVETVDLSAALAGEEVELKAARQAIMVSTKKDFFISPSIARLVQAAMGYIPHYNWSSRLQSSKLLNVPVITEKNHETNTTCISYKSQKAFWRTLPSTPLAYWSSRAHSGYYLSFPRLLWIDSRFTRTTSLLHL